jgi:Carboxypeptidase regulatory-like domain
MSMRSIGLAALGVAASMACALPAFANGGDFFEELAASWSIANADSGVPFFGFVKDSRGKNIPKASVMATTASGSSFVVQADQMGRYRIPGFSKSVDAQKVTINCSKPGYKLVAKDRRVQRGVANPPIETNCILAPDTNKPTA